MSVKTLVCWLAIQTLGAGLMPALKGAAADGDGLLLVSIDGLNPEYVLNADSYGLKIPNLRRVLKDGAYAKGVIGVLPTVTYPSHTTMLTGAPPAKHGIYSNVTFDPERTNVGGWYWYSEDIQSPTLWAAATKAGYVVGSVSWPVSVSADGIRYLIPEYWRAMKGEDELKILRAVSTPGLLTELEKKHGKYIVDLDIATPGDWMRTRYAGSIIRDKRAQVMTLHLASLDHVEHETGPGTPAAFQALEEIDRMVGDLITTIRSVASKAAICIVSDHGMSRVDREVNLQAAFLNAGFITLGAARGPLGLPSISDWKAQAWMAGGSAAIMLKDPGDQKTELAVKKLLDEIAADPANGIAVVMDKQSIKSAGGAPNASFWVDLKPGFTFGSALSGDLTRAVPFRGTHGYSPTHSEMRAAFFLSGPGIRHGAIASDVDMRHIAPTLARHLGFAFPSAELKPLDVFESSK